MSHSLRQYIYTGILFFSSLTAVGQGISSEKIGGRIADRQTGEPVPMASIRMRMGEDSVRTAIADSEGVFHFESLSPGIWTIHVESMGYHPANRKIAVPQSGLISIMLVPDEVHLLEGVVVTARELHGGTSASLIDRTAMKHLQPSSLTDILALLPGGMVHTPQMGGNNQIRLREVGTTDRQYDITSLGTRFLIDGAPIGVDANMQRIPETIAGQSDYARTSVGTGVDMRKIATDNIEKVEIIRGIPSVKYGDLTSGLVNITRRHTALPYEIRFKTDQYGQMAALTKGWELPRNKGILNADFDYLHALTDPRTPMENYQRLGLSARWNNSRPISGQGEISWMLAIDHHLNIDENKSDPERLRSKEDRYQSSYRQWGATSSLRYDRLATDGLRNIALWLSVNYSHDLIKETRHVYTGRDRIVVPDPDSDAEVYDGNFLPYDYVASRQTDGKPFYAYARIESRYTIRSPWQHDFTLGGEWTMSKNYGDGYNYDTHRPVDPESLHRPRAFVDIPGSHQLSAYLEDKINRRWGRMAIELTLGLRSSSLYLTHHSPGIQGRAFIDPRATLETTYRLSSDASIYASLGWGSMSKFPTLTDLSPDPLYFDFIQLYYWHPRADFRRMNIRTFRLETTNRDLRPSRNRKFEFRIGGRAGGHEWSVAAFSEVLKDGFRSATAVSAFSFRRYDSSGIDPLTITSAPKTEDIPWRQDTLLRTWQRVENGSTIRKTGIEWQYSSPRIPFIATRLTFNGAWFHSYYANSRPEWYGGIDKTVLGIAVNSKYVGLYDWEDSYTKDRISANLILDTYLDKIGLLFSTTLEAYLWGKTRVSPQNKRPISYIDVKETIHPYTDEDAQDVYLAHLNLSGRAATRLTSSERAYLCMHVKANKQFGKHIGVALFADRIVSIAPDYEVNGFLIRRHFSPYVGMEINLTI